MKKVLSVLIATIMLISCCSVGLVSFAAAQPKNAEEAIELIAKDTEFLTSSPEAVANPGAWNERPFKYGTAGYTFSRTANASSASANASDFKTAFDVTNDNGTPDDTTDDTNNLNTIKANIAKAYKETGAYADYITFDSTNPSAMKEIDIAKLANDIVGIEEVTNIIDVPVVPSVAINKSMDASKVLGDDVLTKIEIDPNDVVKFASQAFSLENIIVASDKETDVLTTIEASSLAKYVKTLISSDVAAQIKAELENKEGVKAVKDYFFQISNVKITPTYSTNTKYSTTEDIMCMGKTYTKGTAYTTLSALKITYDISYTAGVAFDAFSIDGVDDSYFNYSGKKSVTQKYDSIQRPTELDLKAEDVIDLINSETDRLAVANGTTHTAGYNLSKTVTTSTPFNLSAEDSETIKGIFLANYADRFPAYIDTTSGDVDLDGILCEVLGLNAASGRVDKSMSGADLFGKDALVATKISHDDLKNFSGKSMNAAITLEFGDVDLLAADNASEESIVGDFYANVIPSGTDNAIANDIALNAAGVTIEDISIKYTNISVVPQFKLNSATKAYELSSLKLNYNVEFSANVYAAGALIPVNNVTNVVVNYSNITPFVEGVDIDAGELIDLINSETKRYAVDTDTTHTAGYNLNKTVTTSTQISINSEDRKVVNNIIMTKYADKFGAYIDEEAGVVDYDGILGEVLGMTAASGTVSKSVAGTEIVGKNALIATKLSKDDLMSFTGSSLTAGVTLNFNDVELFADDTVNEECVVADFYDNYIPKDIDKNIANDLSIKVPGTTIEDYSVQYKNIKVIAQFKQNADTKEYELSALSLNYTVDFSANLYAVNAVDPIPLNSVTSIVVNYTDFKPFVEGVDIDAYEFAKYLNEATGYVVADKAGYDYERNSSITTIPSVKAVGGTTVMDAISSIDGLLGTITSAIGGSGTPITDALSDMMKDVLSEDLDATDYVGTVKPAQNAAEALGEHGANYAVKASKVEAKDIYDLQYNAERGVITFTLADAVNPEKDDKNSLSRLTNDFTSVSDIKDKLAVSLGELNIEFMKDTDPCNIVYSNINCYVAFSGADAENVYGDGTLAKLGVNYDCSLDVTAQGLNFVAGQTVLSESNDFKYVDYELGDADQSGKVSIVDAKLVLEYVVGTATLNDEQMKLADMDANGKVTVADAKLILQKVASQTE